MQTLRQKLAEIDTEIARLERQLKKQPNRQAQAALTALKRRRQWYAGRLLSPVPSPA